MATFTKQGIENYGKSKVELKKLDMEKPDDPIEINGYYVKLPALNLKKYNQNAECYAFVEKLEDSPIVMADLIYSQGDILSKFENDSRFRNQFLTAYNRKMINKLYSRYPALVVVPANKSDSKIFADSFKDAIQDSAGKQSLFLQKQYQGKKEIEVKPDPNKVVQDGIAMEFVKDFYEILSGTKIRRPDDVIKKKVDVSMIKQAFLLKSGTMMIGSEEVSKYFTAFCTDMNLKESQRVRANLAFYISGIDSEKLKKSSTYFSGVENAILGKELNKANILEVMAALDRNRPGLLNYAGAYKDKENRIVPDTRIEGYIDEINDRLRNVRQEPSHGER